MSTNLKYQKLKRVCLTDVLKRWGSFHLLLCSLSNVRSSYFKKFVFCPLRCFHEAKTSGLIFLFGLIQLVQEATEVQPGVLIFCDDPSVEKAAHSAVHKINEALTSDNKLALYQILTARKVQEVWDVCDKRKKYDKLMLMLMMLFC